MSKSLAGLVVLLLAVAASNARAQDRNRIGVMIATPTLIGFNWELSERIALRPDFSLSSATTTFTSSEVQVGSTHSYGGTVGLSGVFYVRRWDALRLYLSPRFSYGITRNTATITQKAGSGSLGGQYDLSGRFSLFAEAGVNVNVSSQIFSSTRTLGNRGLIGAILFF